MPPRKLKVTPKAPSQTQRTPAAPRRSNGRSDGKLLLNNDLNNSPRFVKSSAGDAAMFGDSKGSKGTLGYDADANGDPSVHDSDMEMQVSSPTGVATRNKPLKAEKIAGRRRVPPVASRPIKRGVKIAPAMKRHRLQPSSPQVDDGTASNDEGYATEVSDQDMDNADTSDPGVPAEPDASGYYDTDDADEHGNLAGFVVDDSEKDNAAEGPDGEDDMRSNGDAGGDIDDSEGHDIEHDADTEEKDMDVDEVKYKPRVLNTGRQQSGTEKRRTVTDLSDADDDAPVRKRRVVISEQHGVAKTPVFIAQKGERISGVNKHGRRPAPQRQTQTDNKASLKKNKMDKVAELLQQELGMDKATFSKLVSPYLKHNEGGEDQDHLSKDGITSNTDVPVENMIDGEPGGKEREPEVDKDDHSAEPEERGCEVTDGPRQTGPLRGTYNGLPPLKDTKWQLTNELALATLTVLFDEEQFADDMSLDRVRAIMKTICVPSAYMTNPARDHPSRLMVKPYGSGQALAFKKDGEVAGIVAFGINLRSVILEGRTYKNNQGATRLVKEIEIALVMQEGERFLAMLSMVTGGKPFVLPITDNGGITFSTKHTTVDEDGDEEPGKGKIGAGFLKRGGNKVLSGKVVHVDIQRRAREATETVPVFNSTKHFRGDEIQLRKETFRPEEVLTQRARVDASWNKEIPVGAFVAVHGMMTTYKSAKVASKMISFNLSAVQILALPKSG